MTQRRLFAAVENRHSDDPHWRKNVAEPKYNLPRVMTVRELSAYLRVHPSTIYKLLRRGELPGFRIGTDWRFNAEVIDRWCLERNMRPADTAMRGN